MKHLTTTKPQNEPPQMVSIEHAIPVSRANLKQLDADGVEYQIVMRNENISDFVWIQISPSAKSMLGLFHAGVHIGKQQRKKAA